MRCWCSDPARDRRYDVEPPREVRARQGGTSISPQRATRRRLPAGRLVAGVCAACVVVVLLGSGPVHASGLSVPAQSDSTTTTAASDTASTDENPLIVPGPESGSGDATEADAVDGDDEAPADADGAQDDPSAGSTNDEAEDTIRMVMYALIGVAVALAALTAYYWWRTRPARRPTTPRRRGGGPSTDAPDAGGGPTRSGSTEPGDDSTVASWQTDSTSTR